MMEDKLVNTLIEELRGEYQIPPYYTDKSLTNNIKEGNDELLRFVCEIDYDKDLTARSLLKNYVYYAFFNKTYEFFENYSKDLLSWQMSKLNGNTSI